MKKTLSVIFIFSFIKVANAQKPEISLTDLRLKGNVKEIHDSIYYVKQRQSDNSELLPKPIKVLVNFSNAGNKLEEIVFSNDNKIIRKTTYNYKGNRILSFADFIRGKLTFKNIYKYDDKNNIFQIDIYSESRIKLIYEYDNKGNVQKIKTYNDDKSSGQDLLYYNNKNEKNEDDQFNIDGKLVDKTYFKYDPLGNIIKIESYNSDGQLVEEDSYSYSNFDNHGNWQLQLYDTKHDSIIQHKQTVRIIKY